MVKHGILLLGPTQVGKSSLANLLVTGRCDPKSVNKFRIGDGTESCTRVTQCEDFEYAYECLEEPLEKPSATQQLCGTITDSVPMKDGTRLITRMLELSVIDAAGAGDTENKDSQAILDLYKYLAQPNIELSCVVLVIKFPTLNDEKYEKIVKFYKEMLSSIFSNNVVVVITHVELGDKKWVRQHSTPESKPEDVIKKILGNLRKILELDYDLPYYALNTLAHPDDEDDYRIALDSRRNIAGRCATLPGISPTQLSFPKPYNWNIEDEKKLQMLVEQKKTLIGDIAEMDLEMHTKRKIDLQRMIDSLQSPIDGYDNERHITINSTNLRADTAWFLTSMEFDIKTEHPIARVLISAGNLKKNSLIQENQRVRGSVRSDWFSPLNATVTVMGKSNEVHKTKIDEWKTQLAETREKLAQEVERFQRNVNMGKDQQRLEEELAELLSQMAELAKESLSYEQLLKRLNGVV